MNRKEFLGKSALLMAGLGTSSMLHPAILKAISIEPALSSTFFDAEHVVILMQENRSFDHTFGAMKGVRGFADKRAFVKEDGHSVFFQKDNEGRYAAPARLDLKNTKSTWMSSLPHSWSDQQHALNNMKYDQWLQAKASGNKDYKNIPLTLGYHNREDLPFYYQLADAFTVFDQYFCSSLTGTTPNRLFLWSGTIREQQNGSVKANVYNDNIDYDKNRQATWRSFPEILEEQDIPWRIYQNEISLPKGLSGEEESWLSNFTDNPIEWFSNFKVKFSKGYHENIPNVIKYFEGEIKKNPTKKPYFESRIQDLKDDLVTYHPDNFARLSETEKNLHEKAFTINSDDPDYWKVEVGTDETGERLVVPKGDVLHQFRKDVDDKKLPVVSWLIAPERFSDHPSSPWYGAWYISEVLNILTKDPETWKKTILIINYDENDGYFDHVVPFSPPSNPSQPVDLNGKDGVEYVSRKQDYMSSEGLRDNEKIEGNVGLGFRVPMIIASPWTRGGFVNSEVSDHTSVLQFLEKFIQKKYKKDVTVDNISNWRRAVCGDLTTAFNSANASIPKMDYLDQKNYAEQINAAKHKPVPSLKWYKENELNDNLLNIQEKGVKASNALPYRYHVNFFNDKIVMKNNASNGVPLIIYDKNKLDAEDYYFSYALFANQELSHPINSDNYNFEVHGPNGFFRKLKGEAKPKVEVVLADGGHKKELNLIFKNLSDKKQNISFEDLYTNEVKSFDINNKEKQLIINVKDTKGWYDFKVKIDNNLWQFSGRVETGEVSTSDPHWM